jgi:tRNA-2-methylthio-N6-dimethylallyladenosine synthase
MNLHDSEKLAGSLEGQGYVPAEDPENADVILLNTCSIREKAAEKVYSELGRLRRLKRKNPNLVLGVCGCLAQQEGERVFARAEYVDFVLGPRATGSLPSMLERLRSGAPGAHRAIDTEYRADSIRFPYDEIRREGNSSGKAYVTVIEGCNHRCTYCIVPTTRGREICRDMDDVLAEVTALAANGIREVEFLGQTVNAYRDARGRTLAELLLAATRIDGIERMRFTTSHPAQMTERLMDAMAAARPKLCPYLHLPAQSGSDGVLRAMRRGYDRKGYLSKIDGLRRRMPELRLGGDFIVGFPNEQEQDFEQTLSLIEQVEYDTLYSFCYSPRPGTAALDLEDPISQRVKLERLRRLQRLQQEIQERRNAHWVGRQVNVLVEGRSRRDPTKWTGRTPESRVVNFSGPSAPGRMERIGIRRSTAFALDGALVSEFDGQGRSAEG